MPQCQFPVFYCFCISEKLYRKYYRNWTKQKPKSIFYRNEDEVRRADEEEHQGAHTCPWRGQAWARAKAWCGPPRHPTDLNPPPIYTSSQENPGYPSLHPRKVPSRPPLQNPSRGVLKLFPAPCRRGKSSSEASTSPCPPPK